MRVGNRWVVVFEDKTMRFEHIKGFEHLARLLAQPGDELYVGELLGRAVSSPMDEQRCRKAAANGIHEAIRRIELRSPRLGEHLRRAVITGRYCSYGLGAPLAWITDEAVPAGA